MSRRPAPHLPALAFAAVAISVIMMAVAWSMASFHALPRLAPDSRTYLAWDVARTPAYPLFLRIVPAGWVPAVQLLAIAAGSAWLAYEMRRVVRPYWCVLLQLSILGNVALVSYAFTILPEALFIAAVMAYYGLALRFIDRPLSGTAMGLGAVSMTIALLKPSGYSFVTSVAPIAWIARAQLRTIALLAAPIVVLLSAASAVNFVRSRVVGTQAFGGFSALGYVGQFLDRSPDDALQASFVELAAPVGRELERIHGIDAYYFASGNAFHDVQDAQAIIADGIHRQDPGATTQQVFVRLNAIAWRWALTAIREHPREYLRQVSVNWYGLWFIPGLRNAADEERFAEELRQLNATAPTITRNGIVYRTVPPWVYWPVKIALGGVFVASLVGLILAAGRPVTLQAAALAAASVALHANFLLVSGLQTGLPRYALAMWPLTMMILILTAALLVGGVRLFEREHPNPDR
jgi:hypothetical protein